MAGEKRLIDAYALAGKVWDVGMYIYGVRNGKTLIKEYLEKYRDSVMREIAIAPIIDAVELVRCKDCKHYSLCESCSEWHTDTNPEDFCSRGERKDND